MLKNAHLRVLQSPWIEHERMGIGADESLALHKKHLAEAAQYKPIVLFVGDSITANWAIIGKASWDKYFAPLRSYDLAIGGENTQASLWRFEHHALDNLNPKIVVLMIGTNNLFIDSAEDTVHGILAVVSQLKLRLPQSKILLLGILPRGLTPGNSVLRSKIRDTNLKLAAIDWKNVSFLDISETVLSPDQSVDSSLMPDGVHPSEEGYNRMAPQVSKALNELLLGDNQNDLQKHPQKK
jgi:beta-glucosidase